MGGFSSATGRLRSALSHALGAEYEPPLPPGLVDDHGDCVGKIDAAALWYHRDPDSSLPRLAVQHLGGQAARFRSKQKGVPG